MAAARETLTPNVTWAQRPNFIFITFDVAEVGKPLFKVPKYILSLVSRTKHLFRLLKTPSDLKGKVSAIRRFMK